MKIIKDNKITVLVTGGSGFIGSYLVDRLIKLEYYVINLDKFDYCSFDNTKNIVGSYKFIHGNVSNKELVTYILNEHSPKIIFHLAAQTTVDNSFYNPIQFTYDNIFGTHNLLECIRESNEKLKNTSKCVEKINYTSTDEACSVF